MSNSIEMGYKILRTTNSNNNGGIYKFLVLKKVGEKNLGIKRDIPSTMRMPSSSMIEITSTMRLPIIYLFHIFKVKMAILTCSNPYCKRLVHFLTTKASKLSLKTWTCECSFWLKSCKKMINFCLIKQFGNKDWVRLDYGIPNYIPQVQLTKN